MNQYHDHSLELNHFPHILVLNDLKVESGGIVGGKLSMNRSNRQPAIHVKVDTK